jgi:hypothetical protein
MADLISMLSAASGATAEADPNFNSTVLLLHGDGTNGAQNNTFLDSSTNNFTITRNGNVTQGSFGPFSRSSGNLVNAPYDPAVHGGSGYFDGSGDYLKFPDTTVGSGAFTFEFWFYCTGSFSSAQTIIGPDGATNGLSIRINSATQFSVDRYNVGASNYTVPSMALNTWHHVAVVRDGSNNETVFLNGTRSSTGSTTDSFNYGIISTIGRLDSTFFQYFTGYLSNVRVVLGSAVYSPSSSTITVPTAQLTAITNTSLLCNFTNAGIFDNTGKNNLETVGNAQIDTAVVKYGTGSMEFDGTDDRLVMPSNPELNLSSGNFTIEAWVYWTGSNANAKLLSKDGASGSSYAQYNLGMNGSGYMGASIGSGNGVSYIQSITSNTLLPTNQWVHIAFVKNGTNLSLYQNGTSVASATQSGTMVDGAKPLLIGYETGQAASNYWNGYIDDLRITKGVARYTANFTAPTKAFPDQ